MHIGIIGALTAEIALIQEQIKNPCIQEKAKRKYFSGTLYNVATTVVASGCGKVAAAIAASTLISEFKVDKIIFIGTAGGIAPFLNIGDVVISTKLYHHDMDPRPIFPRYEIPLTGKSYFEADCQMQQLSFAAATQAVKKDLSNITSNTGNKYFINTVPNVYSGLIGSGDCFVNNTQRRNDLIMDTLAVEMEGAAVAQVCDEHNLPFVVIRIISDRADHSAAIYFLAFLRDVASHFSNEIIKILFQKSNFSEAYQMENFPILS